MKLVVFAASLVLFRLMTLGLNIRSPIPKEPLNAPNTHLQFQRGMDE
jgi:hypothetical protein